MLLIANKALQRAILCTYTLSLPLEGTAPVCQLLGDELHEHWMLTMV